MFTTCLSLDMFKNNASPLALNMFNWKPKQLLLNTFQRQSNESGLGLTVM